MKDLQLKVLGHLFANDAMFRNKVKRELELEIASLTDRRAKLAEILDDINEKKKPNHVIVLDFLKEKNSEVTSKEIIEGLANNNYFISQSGMKKSLRILLNENLIQCKRPKYSPTYYWVNE